MDWRANRALTGGVMVAAVLVLLVALFELLGWPFLRQPLQNLVASRSGLPTTLAEGFKLRLIGPPRLNVGHLHLGAAPALAPDLEVPHLLDAREVHLRWRWSALWRWRQGERLRVRTLQAAALDANLIRLGDGRASWLGERPGTQRDANTDTQLPLFGALVVGQGRIAWLDQPLAVDLLIRLQGREGTAVASDAAGYVGLIEGRYRDLPMKLAIEAGGTLPLLNDAESAEQAPWVPLRVEGSVASSAVLFEGRAAALLGAPRWDGGLRFRGPSLAQVGRPLGVTLPQTPPFDLRGHIAQAGGMWQLRVDQATVGSSQLQGELQFEQHAKPKRLSGQLNGPRLALADLAPAIGAGGAGQQNATPPGRVLPHRRFDLPSLKAMDADVQMQLDVLDLGSASVAPLRGLKTRVLLQAGVLRLEELQAGVAGGRLQGRTQLNANASPARWQAQLRVSGIDMAGWLRGLSTRDQATPSTGSAAGQRRQRQAARQGGDQPVQAYLTGELTGDLNVNGTGRSTAEILGSLSGRAELNIREGTLSYLATEVMGLDVAQALGVAITGDRPLPLNCARLTLVARNGVVEPRPAVLDNVDSTIWLTGRVSLREETLDLRAITRPKDWSPLSLRTPLTITGTLADPNVGIEGGRLVGRVLGALALGALVGPAAALLPLIEQGDGNVERPCEPRTTGPPPAGAGAPSAPPPPAPAPR
jgi:AsmA family protein